MNNSSSNPETLNEPLTLLKEYGDLLERAMFDDINFAAQFSGYPKVWSRYILPNRDKDHPTLATKDWMRLGEHNYSAIVRSWNVRRAASRIDDICTYVAGTRAHGAAFLDLQEALLTFFGCAGGAIDNLRGTFFVPPVSLPTEAPNPLYASQTGWGSLKWIYERRTQSVHKVLIPCYESAGVPSFDVSFFDNSETHWDQARGTDVRAIDEIVGNIWLGFAQQMNSAWHVLFDQLKHVEPASGSVAEEINIVNYKLEWSSASPQDSHGSPCYCLPSGSASHQE